jgi:hypothetical protein
MTVVACTKYLAVVYLDHKGGNKMETFESYKAQENHNLLSRSEGYMTLVQAESVLKRLHEKLKKEHPVCANHLLCAAMHVREIMNLREK